jgi:hypothetical protein
MTDKKLYGYLAQIFKMLPHLDQVATLQTATVLGLVAFLAGLCPARAAAQATGRVEVRATVVNVTASRSAVAAMRWLLAQNRDARRERGLATIEVSREKRKVAINYLKN